MNSQQLSGFPTPLYPQLSSKYRDVYEPAEDTFLLLDALEKESIFLNQLKLAVSKLVFSYVPY